jgi:exodeoxyribonuclease VII small subunit
MAKNEKYSEAYHELNQIVEDMQDGNIGVDELSAKVKRASELIKICKGILTNTEKDVKDILKDLGEKE